MGETKVKTRIYGLKGSVEIKMLVDTGARSTKISASLASRLGLKACEPIDVKLGEGSVRQRGLTDVKLEIDKVERTVPIVIGPDGEEPVLGYTSLK